MPFKQTDHKVVLITGAARRIGRCIAEHLHSQGWNIAIHYFRSVQEAQQLNKQLNEARPNSAMLLSADLALLNEVNKIPQIIMEQWGRLDAFVHNASSFFPTPIGTITEDKYDKLFTSNFKAPLFLGQILAPYLRQHAGNYVFIVDAHLKRLKKEYSVYYSAKAALQTLVKTFALELAPDIRVNGVAPGAIIWPEGINTPTEESKLHTLTQIPLQRSGQPSDIAETVAFLLHQNYVTGQIIAVDGGRSL